IALVFDIPHARCLQVRIVGYLIVIPANSCDQAQLVVGSFVEDDGAKTAEPGSLIVKNLSAGSFQAEVSAVSGKATVISEALSMVAEADLVIRVVKAAVAGDEFSLPVALEPGSGDYVEDTIRAVAVISRVATTLDFEIIDVFGIKLRAHIRSDIG